LTRRRWATAAYALAASGCSLLYGLHDNQGPIDDAGVDATSGDAAHQDATGDGTTSEDATSESQDVAIQDAPSEVEDVAESSVPPMQPPNAPCGAGNQGGPDNGTCGPDGRVYYCYQGVWHLKEDCVKLGAGCIIEPPNVADECATVCPQCGVGRTCDAGVCE
jgi:hypothetical protein